VALVVAAAGCSAVDLGTESGGDGHQPTRGDDDGWFAAGGIELDRITVDQGVAVDVHTDGHDVAGDERTTLLISGRPAYARALWDVPDDWVARDIEAVMRVTGVGDGPQTARQRLWIDAPSNEAWLDGAFAWVLPAEWMTGDTAITVGFYEVGDDDPGLPLSAGVPHASADLAIDERSRVIEVVLVRIAHTYDGGHECGGAPVIDETMQADLASRLRGINPVVEVDLTVREQVLVFDQPANDFAVILDELSALRETDEAPPWVYYYGLIDLCDWGSDEGFGGQARVPDEVTPELAWKRVAVGTSRESYGAVLGTFVHELGHAQGRRHVPCSGEKFTVEDYPYRDAMIASAGFDLERWILHVPTHRDYMSYCSPDWVGEYGWNAVLPVIDTLTDWRTEGASVDTGERMLVGTLYPDGTERWWTARGRARAGESAAGRVAFSTRAGERIEVPARQGELGGSPGRYVMVDLPVSVDEIVSIERFALPGTAMLDPTDIRRAAR
jgi:hypothetical protein